MIEIGKYTVPTGPNEEIVPRPTLMERFSYWLIRDPLIDAERELILQQARRLKLKTDLQEKRIATLLKRQKERELHADNPKLFGTLIYKGVKLGNEVMNTTITLSENSKKRKWSVQSVEHRGTGESFNSSKDDVYNFIKTQAWYFKHILPWLQGTISTDKLKEMLNDSKLVTCHWV